MNTTKQADNANARLESRELVDLFHTLESPLLGFAYQMVKNEQIAQDLVQDAFIRLQARLAEIEKPKAWLYTIVRRLAIDHLRKARKVVPFAQTEDGAPVDITDAAPGPDEMAEQDERTSLMRVCLERLERRQRILVTLKFIDELSYKQIAQRMGISVGNVGYRLHHALKALEVELNKEGISL